MFIPRRVVAISSLLLTVGLATTQASARCGVEKSACLNNCKINNSGVYSSHNYCEKNVIDNTMFASSMRTETRSVKNMTK